MNETPNYPIQDNECKHEWSEHPDSMFSNESYADVRCVKCGIPGEQNRKTKKVFYPAT